MFMYVGPWFRFVHEKVSMTMHRSFRMAYEVHEKAGIGSITTLFVILR